MDNIEFILGISCGLCLALFFGFITQKMKLSPIIGYLIAGFIVGPHTPGVVIHDELAKQLAEIGIILLMFSIGLHFHPKDLFAVRKISLPGAIIEISLMTTIGSFVARSFGLSFNASILFGISISIASTVILMRILSDNKTLNTPTGHIAIGWLIVEDFFTIFALVLIPVLVNSANTDPFQIISLLLLTVFKIILLVFCILFIGKKILPPILIFIARTGARDLFTLAILTIALGTAVLSTKLFGASMAIGAFLAGMLVGQSDFGERATAEALPIKDTFSVLFFLSIGMLFNPISILEYWKFSLTTLLLVLIGKPTIATLIVLCLKQPLKKAVSIGISLAQIGEFSFILATLGITLNLFDGFVANAIIATAIISITLNPILYKNINFILRCLAKIGIKEKNHFSNDIIPCDDGNTHRIIIVGFGPVGRCLTKILNKNGFNIVIIEMNIDTVRKIKSKHGKNIHAIYGDATNREILLKSGIEYAKAFIISTSLVPSKELTKCVQSLNPRIRILAHTQYLSEAKALNSQSPNIQLAFSGEFAVALYLSKFLMKELNFNDEIIKEECNNLEEILL